MTHPVWPCERCGTLFVGASPANSFCSTRCARNTKEHDQGVIDAARQLWYAGLSTREIGLALTEQFPPQTFNKNMVVGIAHRNEDFPARPSPIRRAT